MNEWAGFSVLHIGEPCLLLLIIHACIWNGNRMASRNGVTPSGQDETEWKCHFFVCYCSYYGKGWVTGQWWLLTNELHDINWGALDYIIYASHAPQLILGITQSAVECLAQLYMYTILIRVTSRDVITHRNQRHIKFTSIWQTRLAYKCMPYSSHRFSVQMDISPLGYTIAMLVSEETWRCPYKASDKVWICHGEVKI